MNRYKFQDRIGAGGHGDVFRAKLVGTEEFSRPVAIKRIREQLSGDERYTKLFIEEARIASKLQHANIVSVLDFYRDEAKRLCLVMELVDGVSLSELIKAGPLPFSVAVYLTTEVLRGLGYAHGAPFKLVHRDVTPKNILVGWNGAVKLSDFGLAKVQARVGAETSGVKGTLGYISPDHIDEKPLDGRADLFAVGVILYQLLTGQVPFRCNTLHEYIFALVRGEVERPRNIRPEIPEELEAITMRLLERNRDRRYASAQAAMYALQQCEHASRWARDELVAILAEPSVAGLHADTEPAQKSASEPERDIAALLQAKLDIEALIQAQLLEAKQQWGQAASDTPHIPPEVHQRERFPFALLAREHHGEPVQPANEKPPEPVDQPREPEQRLQPAPATEGEAPPWRRGWLAALAVGAALAAAMLALWPLSNVTRDPMVEENAPNNARETDRGEPDTENIVDGPETIARPVDEPTVPAVESMRPRKRSTDAPWEGASASNSRGSDSWGP